MSAGELAGKVVVVTGAGSGIGRATALLFARLGAKVHVVDISAERAEKVRGEIEAAGGHAAAHTVDCADHAAVEALAERVFADDGGVDVLHNNAGIGHAGAVEETTLDDWRRVIEVNLMGTIHGVHAFVPRLLLQGRPSHVVNTASLAGLVAAAEMAPYVASKFGVVGLTESLNAELSPRGIHFSAICPGIIDTSIVDDAVLRGEHAERAEETRSFYRRRGASPDVVAEAVVDAVRRHRLIVPVPRLHVVPPWMIKRASPRVAQFITRNLPRLVRSRR
jgi:NAD(P)-dependent dehydrogenase (short-subunit alcohol dehydrogenase family)